MLLAIINTRYLRLNYPKNEERYRIIIQIAKKRLTLVNAY